MTKSFSERVEANARAHLDGEREDYVHQGAFAYTGYSNNPDLPVGHMKKMIRENPVFRFEGSGVSSERGKDLFYHAYTHKPSGVLVLISDSMEGRGIREDVDMYSRREPANDMFPKFFHCEGDLAALAVGIKGV